MFLLVNNRPIQSADSIGFWPIVSVSADSQNSTIGRPLHDGSGEHEKKCMCATTRPRPQGLNENAHLLLAITLL